MEKLTLELTRQQLHALYTAVNYYYEALPTSDKKFEQDLVGLLKNKLVGV